MGKRAKIWCALTAMAATTPAHAQLLSHYEPFDYTPGGPLVGGAFPWGSGAAVAGDPGAMVSAGNLSSPSLLLPRGNSVELVNSSTGVNRLWTGAYVPDPAGPTSVYYSLLLRVNDLAGAAAGGAFVAGFNNADPSNTGGISTAGARLQIRPSASMPGQFELGVRNDVSGGRTSNLVWDTTSRAVGDTIHIVAAYEFNAGALTNDVARMWINPSLDNFGRQSAPATALLSTGADISQEQIRNFFLRQVAAGPASITIDELRVDSTWAGVAPVQWALPADGTWDAGANWSTGAQPDAVGTFATFSNTLAAPATVIVESPKAVAGMLFHSYLHPYTIAGQSITLAPEASLRARINVTGGDHTVATPLVLAQDLDVFTTLGSGLETSLTLAGPISGAGGIRKTGSGTLTLAGNNSFSGGITHLGGTLLVAGGGTSFGAAPPTSNVNVHLLGGRVNFTAGGAFPSNQVIELGGPVELWVTAADPVTLAGRVTGGMLRLHGGGTLSIPSLANDYSGGTRIVHGTLRGNSDSIPTFNGVTLQGESAESASVEFDQAFNGTFAGVVGGIGSLIKSGPATLRLAAANTYTGQTIVRAGVLEVAAANNLGGRATFDGVRLEDVGTLRAAASFDSPLSVTVAPAANAAIDTGPHAVSFQVLFGAPGAHFTKRGTGSLEFWYVVRDEFHTPSSGAVTVEAGSLHVTREAPVVLESITVADGARFVIADAPLILRGQSLDAVTALIASGRNGGAWDGSGIATGMPDALTGLTSLGVATAQQAGYAGGTFKEFTVTAGDVLVMYTYAGDATLDGFISGDDYSAIDFASGVAGASGWHNGDFNYDGLISGDDYSIIDFNLVAQGAPFSTANPVVAVPEPTGAAALWLASAALRRRPRCARRS